MGLQIIISNSHLMRNILGSSSAAMVEDLPRQSEILGRIMETPERSTVPTILSRRWAKAQKFREISQAIRGGFIGVMSWAFLKRSIYTL